MAETKHTPGPWVWSDYTQEVPADSVSACELISYGPEDAAGSCSISSILALDEECSIEAGNARLIAAAPELLEALRAIKTAASMELALGGLHPSWEPIIIECNKAIAKAEGRQ